MNFPLNTGAKRLEPAKPFSPDRLRFNDQFYLESYKMLYTYVGKTDKGNYIYMSPDRRVFESKNLKPVMQVKN